MKRKIDIEIENKALERYPYEFVPDDTTMGVEKYDKNELLRIGYINALKDIFNGKMMWKIYSAGVVVKEEFYGKLTATSHFGEKMLDKIEL